MKILVVESEFSSTNSWVGSAIERLVSELKKQDVTLLHSSSFDDACAILSANEAIDCLMFSYLMQQQDEHQGVQQMLAKLRERQQNVPVFLLGEREQTTARIATDLLENIDEFVWILEDSAEFIAGRAIAAMTRYRQQCAITHSGVGLI